MKMKSKWLIALLALVMAFSMTACGGSEEPAEEPAEEAVEEIVVPDEILELRAEVEGYAADYAKQLTDDGWADQYVALLESGEAREYADYETMYDTLSDMRVECGATYIYALTPLVDDEITFDVEDTNEVPFAITVDGCEDPDDWGVEYEWEIQFTEAWEGAAASARSAWINDEVGDNHDICWSAFAPVYDSEDNVVCILGIDYPCADLLNDMPEWNRDADEWCGYEGE